MPFSKTKAPISSTPVLPISVATPVLVLMEYKRAGDPFVKYNVAEPVEAPVVPLTVTPVDPISVLAPVVVFTE